MAPEIAELFPDSFVDSTLGSVPKGWRPGRIGELAALDKTSLNPSAFPDEVFDHYSIPAFDDDKHPIREAGNHIKSNKFVVPPDSVLLTKLNPRIPRVWLPFPSQARRSLCSTEFLVLKPKLGVGRAFLFSLVSSEAFLKVYATMVTGTSGSHQRIRPEHFLNMETVIPQEAVRTAFAGEVGEPLTHSESLRCMSRSLTHTRDHLLPKLLSGELTC
jgi:type I restriction enzyme S subunit